MSVYGRQNKKHDVTFPSYPDFYRDWASNGCGNCKYNKRDWTNPNNPDFYCSNDQGEYYGAPTAYEDVCDAWEAKE